MNTKHISLAFAAAAALLAGCAKNPIEEVKLSEQFTDLELAYVGATEVKSVIDDTDFPQTGEIGLFLFKDEQAETPYGESGYTNVKYVYNSTKDRWTASPSIKVGSTSGYLFGYYPYDSEVANIKAIPVASSLNGDDVMYASKQAEPVTDKTAANTSITMNHALARVSITVKNNGYTDAAKLSEIKFADAKTSLSGSLDATTGAISGTTRADVTLTVPSGNQTITSDGTTYECLLVSSEKEESKQTVKLTLTIDGIDKEATLSGDNGVIIAQNTKSNITITLSNKGITVQTVSVEDWNVVEVGGHKVTVKVNEIDAVANDILIWAYADEDAAKIEAFSKSGKNLGYAISGNAQCTKSKADNIYTFTISDITSNITASIGYQHVTGISLNKTTLELGIGKTETLSMTIEPEDAVNKKITWSSGNDDIATVDENGKVTAIAEGEVVITATAEDGGLTAQCNITVYAIGVFLDRTSVNPAKGWIVSLKATIIPADAQNKNVTWSSDKTSVATVDEKGNVTAVAEGEANITVTTEEEGKTATCKITVGPAISGSLPYEFSVSDTKKVHFSKGNLWCGKAESADASIFNFEDNQYDTTPSKMGMRSDEHISHFIWCSSDANAMALKYDNRWKGDAAFFAAKGFTINGYSGWSVLTGNSGGEWEYLLNKREGNRSAKARVHGINGLLVFPDGYSLPSGYSSYGGTGMSNVNATDATFPTSDIPDDADNKIWSEMEATGVVFLPAAGYRNGRDGDSSMKDVGNRGYYWSASPNGSLSAYDLYFSNGTVAPYYYDARNRAQSVRLVIESN